MAAPGSVAWYRGTVGKEEEIATMRAGHREGLALLLTAPAVALCVVLLLSACTDATSTSGSGPSSSADTSPAATATATPATLPGAPLPASHGPAILGADISAFVGQYGQPTSASDPIGGRYDFANGSLLAYTDVYSGSPYNERVIGVDDHAPANQPWSPATANRLCLGLAPADAQFVSEASLTSSQGLEGVDEVYQSAGLANAFPAARFMDASGNQTQPGSFDIEYLYPAVNQSGSYVVCSLLIGTQRNNG
jgi:hypothetical protein